MPQHLLGNQSEEEGLNGSHRDRAESHPFLLDVATVTKRVHFDAVPVSI